MKRWLFAAVAACSSGPKPPPGGYSPLPPEPGDPPRTGSAATEPVPSNDGVPDPPVAVISFPATGPACMPAGDYQVAFDFSTTLFTVAGGMDQKFCEAMAEGIATKNLAAMRLGFDGGNLSVEWPQPQTVIVTGDCEFKIVSRPAPATITFEAGTGTGTTEFTLGTPNHPDERCNAKNVKLTITR